MDKILMPRTYNPVWTPLQDVPGFAGTAKNILTAEECSAIIQIAEEKGFVPAALYTDSVGRDHFSETRKSYRCLLDSYAFVDRLWERIQSLVPPVWKGATCIGLNERLRILRYDPGDEFRPHRDGSYTSPTGAISKLTLLLYLNEGYEGAWTAFLNSGEDAWVPIPPRTGMIALQDQDLVHSVPPLQEGRKYVLRTDVMYMPTYTQGQWKEIVIRE